MVVILGLGGGAVDQGRVPLARVAPALDELKKQLLAWAWWRSASVKAREELSLTASPRGLPTVGLRPLRLTAGVGERPAQFYCVARTGTVD